MVGVNFSRVKLLVGGKYWSPLKSWSLFTGFFSPVRYAESVLQEISDKKQKEKQPSEVFYKKGCLKNLTKFTGKLLCWKESCRPESYNFIEKRSQYRCLEHLFLQNICQRQLLKKAALKNFAKFTRKFCCRSLFLTQHRFNVDSTS